MKRFEISAMTLGPYGLGHLDGKIVMTPNVAPGDLVEAAITDDRRDYALAGAPRVIHPGPDRREPPCIYLPRCGGCDWQQIIYAAQIRLKAELLAAEFRRAFAIDLDPRELVLPAPAEFAYRARVRLMVGRDGALGFHELQSNHLVPVERCLVAAAELEAAAVLTRVLAPRCTEIEIVAGDAGQVLIVHLSQPPAGSALAAVRAIFASDRAVAGVILRSKARRDLAGEVTVTLTPQPGCEIRAAADCFSQVNHAQNQRLVAAVMELGQITEATSVLDLFCGAGNFSLPAARRGATVTGVDADANAIAAARDNAARMNLRRTQFIAMPARETARFLERARYRPELVILDPPRTGAAQLMETVARLKAAQVLYVSCDPSTLLRDLGRLAAAGYRLGRVRAFDFFPQTHHLEAVAEMLLT
ncbi:MAG TPA: methyltransferase domain-containing protein [Candidatus Binataceae bacterium]|nr:methyltransferase domain-containing protein [Candidatus Binataceae bacterium]